MEVIFIHQKKCLLVSFESALHGPRKNESYVKDTVTINRYQKKPNVWKGILKLYFLFRNLLRWVTFQTWVIFSGSFKMFVWGTFWGVFTHRASLLLPGFVEKFPHKVMLNLAAKELRVQSSKSFPQALERWWYEPKGCECPKHISGTFFFVGWSKTGDQ